MTDFLRPIVGIENRTPQEVFEIMCARFGRAAAAPEDWEPIETAPRDGRHIQAAIIGTSFGFNAGRPLPEVQTVVHWFSDPDAPGFYTSVNEQEPQRPFPATHWKYLTRIVPLPDDLKCRGLIDFNTDQAIHIACKVAWALLTPPAPHSDGER